MKKIILFILLIGAFINQSYAQKGITAHYIRNGEYVTARTGSYYETTSGNGFALGYMYYKNDRQFKQLKFSYIGSSAAKLERNVYNNSGPSTYVTYQDHYKTFIFSYEKYTIWGNAEMDDANMWYGYRAWDFIYENRSYDMTSSDPGRNVMYDESQDNSKRLSPIDIGLRLGLGFQHNFSHKVGAFIDMNVGFRFLNLGYAGNTNIGIRMNLK